MIYSACKKVANRPGTETKARQVSAGVPHENSNRTPVPTANMEQDSSHESLGAKKITGFNTPVHIRVISYRKRPHDTDGVSAKAVLDGIVRRGILQDDTSKQVESITFESRQSDDEKTIIEIDGA